MQRGSHLGLSNTAVFWHRRGADERKGQSGKQEFTLGQPVLPRDVLPGPARPTFGSRRLTRYGSGVGDRDLAEHAMTMLNLAAPASLRADAERLREAVAPTLARVGMLEPKYADAFDLLCASALAFFSLRTAYNADVVAGRLAPDDREAEHELGEWRRLVVRQCADFGLLPAPSRRGAGRHHGSRRRVAGLSPVRPARGLGPYTSRGARMRAQAA